jgi:preprotein translocase subunit SecA
VPPIIDSVLRAGEGRILRKLKRISEQVNSIEDDFVAMSDAQLRGMTDEFRQRLADGEDLDDLLPEAFATVREAAKRTLGQRHFDVQVMGGAALHMGNIAEMKTGEGKTLTAVLPAYLNALEGNGVHQVTVNDYLAKRDAEWMGRIHRFLGLEVGVILAQMTPAERKVQYAADVTYGTNNEFGFDYLRDNMAWSLEECVQRGHHYAIVDEVDSILIDEARTPLIISGPADQSPRWYVEFAKIAPRLRRGEDGEDGGGDYEVDEKKKTVAILESGVEKVEDWLGIDNLYDPVNTPLVSFLNNSIKAKELYKRDKDYVVMNGEVLIVDEFTGRILHGRRYNEGMHQAIEAKEGVPIKDENQTLATITLQNYFRLYEKLAGMTGTAMTEANEFHQIYKLGVVPIPTNLPMIRADQADVVYQTMQSKFEAVVEDIVERNRRGQPMLVGTTSVEKSEILSKMLKRRGVSHEVLNAKYHEREAAIVAQAGRKGGVTVATNMAGRGTDIMLGGNPEFIADIELHQRGLSPVETPEDYEAAWPEAVAKAKRAVEAEHAEVVELGGLYVLGTERHESRRIDDQLRGRSGRQGDPGESRFYLSLEDDLMRMFNSGRVAAIMERLSIPPDVPVESKVVTRAIRSAQTQVEQQNFEIRKDVLKYDDVLNRQRQVVYGERHEVLEGADLYEQITRMIDEVIAEYVTAATSDGYPEEWDLDKLWRAFRQLFPIDISVDDVVGEAGGERAGLTSDIITEMVTEDAHGAYERREEEFGSEVTRELERRVVLSVLDRKWREHLYEMDYLREGIGLRGYGQRDPLVEYQREGYDMFNAMMDGIKEESVGHLFNLQVQVQENPIVEEAPAGTAVPAAFGAAPAVAPGPAGPVAPADAVGPPGGRPIPAQGAPADVAAAGDGPTTAGRPARGPRAGGAPPGTGGHAAPAGGRAAPAGGRAAPAGGGAAPAGGGAAPAGGGAAPAGGRAAPAGGRAAPGGGRAAPGGGRAAPGGTAAARQVGRGAAGGADAQSGRGAGTQSGRGVGTQSGRGVGTQSGRGAGAQADQGATAGPGAPAGRGAQRSAGGRQRGGAHARPPAGQPAPVAAGLGPGRRGQLQYSAPSVDGGAQVETSMDPAARDEFAHVGRNDPCPCGSGRKFKRCHGDPRMRPDA